MKKILPETIWMMMVFLFFSFTVSALQVQPMVFNFDLRPGDTEEFSLLLTGGTARQTASFTLMQTVQNIEGRLSYQEPEAETSSALNWVRLEDYEVTIPANERVYVRGSIDVPFDAHGSHTAIIMVDQTDPLDRPDALVGFRIRYAVRININVDRPGLRPSVDIVDFSLALNDQGLPIISTHFKNTSPLSFSAVADVTIRDQNRRLIERIPVYSAASSLIRRENFRVYPENDLIYEGEITKPLFPGTYELQLFFRFAEGRQIIKRKTVEIGEEFLREELIRYITIEPDEISTTVRPGASTSQMIEFSNITSEPLIINTFQQDVFANYRNSLYTNLEVSLRGDRQFVLSPHAKIRQVLTFSSNRDIAPGGYYGYHEVEVYNGEGNLLVTNMLELTSIVEGYVEKKGEILDFSYNQGLGVDIFSTTVKNLSNIEISPRVLLQLFDHQGEIYANINLTFQEGENKILPDATAFLTGERHSLSEGEYKAIITLEIERTEIVEKEFLFSVKEYNKKGGIDNENEY